MLYCMMFHKEVKKVSPWSTYYLSVPFVGNSEKKHTITVIVNDFHNLNYYYNLKLNNYIIKFVSMRNNNKLLISRLSSKNGATGG